MKFNVGDQVRRRKNCRTDSGWRYHFSSVDQILIISKYYKNNYITFEGNFELWHENCFELVKIVEPKKEDFYDTKIFISSPEQSKKIQKRMFELGFSWDITSDKIVKHQNKNALFFDDDDHIEYSSREYFRRSEVKEIVMRDIFPEEYNNITYNSYKKVKKEDFYNTKIFISSPEQSKKIQKRMFKLGFSWGRSVGVNYLDEEALFFDEGNMITHGTKDYALSTSERIIIMRDIFPEEDTSANNSYKNAQNKAYDKVLKEENKMDLKDYKVENLKEAEKQFDEEKKNAEIEQAKKQLRYAKDEIDRLDREIKTREEEKKQHLETLNCFKVKNR